jgi:uncharacterized small protein (TIGR04563 family)
MMLQAVATEGAMARDPRKVSLYLPDDMLKQIELEAHRQDRSMSWIVRQAWVIAKRDLQQLPGADLPEHETDR